VATESFSAIRMVKAYGAQDRMAERYNKWVYEVKRHGLYTSPFLGLNFGAIFFGTYGAFGLSRQCSLGENPCPFRVSAEVSKSTCSCRFLVWDQGLLRGSDRRGWNCHGSTYVHLPRIGFAREDVRPPHRCY
jgi:hypothetical protein